MDSQTRKRIAIRVSVFGAIVNLFLGIIKMITGVVGQSHALVADGVHSLSDLATDVLVLVASHFGSKSADAEHPYGHQRIETAGTFGLAILLILTGSGIVYDAIWQLLFETHVDTPHVSVLVIGLISIVLNEVLYFVTKIFGHKIKSDLLLANAWHHRSDSASSFVVLLGAGFAYMGYLNFDLVAAIIVGCLIIKMAIDFGWRSIRELVDTGVDPKTQAKIIDVIKSVEGVQSIHQLRTRLMASNIFVDVHVMVPPYLTVSEGHHFGQMVHHALIREIPSITDVTVHIDPEDDESEEPSYHLLPRSKILPHIHKHVEAIFDAATIDRINLHYLSGEIQVEVFLSGLPINTPRESLKHQLEAHILAIESVQSVRVYLRF